MYKVDVIIIGAGAAGLMCAIEAGKRGRQVIVLDKAHKPGKKILMSGGGRCNFTNYYISPERYLSHNPHFCKSALSRYTQWDFIDLVKKHKIPFHEKTLGQLFCDHKSQDIVAMLLKECDAAGVTIRLNCQIESVEKENGETFYLKTSDGIFYCSSLVIASGGLSIPTMGSSPLGYKIAEKFNIPVWPTRAGLVPFTLNPQDKEKYSTLSGIPVDSLVEFSSQHFRENILFTHRGLSGPAILQISSYWQPGQAITINLLPDKNVLDDFKTIQKHYPKKQLKTFFLDYLPKRVIETFLEHSMGAKALQTISYREFDRLLKFFTQWQLKPSGTEGYRTAEVTLGGVDCDALSSKTMAVRHLEGLYFIGEVVDVTGWLGGYNFQWAWASGWCAGQVA